MRALVGNGTLFMQSTRIMRETERTPNDKAVRHIAASALVARQMSAIGLFSAYARSSGTPEQGSARRTEVLSCAK